MEYKRQTSQKLYAFPSENSILMKLNDQRSVFLALTSYHISQEADVGFNI